MPSLCIPTHIEQLMNGYGMERMGAGIALKPGEVASRFEEVLTMMLCDCRYREGAMAVAERYAGYDQKNVVERLATTVERMAVTPSVPG